MVHSKVCHKLASYGVSGKLLGWLTDFLTNRVQSVKVNNSVSDYAPVKSGVPQGSVLGPVLFLIYINDLVDLFGEGLNVKLFADDLKIYAVINDINDINMFQAGLDALHDWSCTWQLPISIQKCSVLHLGRKNVGHSYFVNGVSLPNVQEVIDLGVAMDSNLRFIKHYRMIASKAHHRASLILRTFRSRDPKLLFKAFTVFVRPLLEYCSPVWAPVFKTDIDIIERVQRRFTKKLFGMRNLTYGDRLNKLNVDTLELRRLKSDLTMIFKIIHHDIKLDFDYFFGLRSVEYRVTRGHCFKLLKPICNNNARQFSFACRRIDAWNSLSNNVVCSQSAQVFKRSINFIDFNNFLLHELL